MRRRGFKRKAEIKVGQIHDEDYYSSLLAARPHTVWPHLERSIHTYALSDGHFWMIFTWLFVILVGPTDQPVAIKNTT